MEVQYKSADGQFVVNFDVKDQVSLFEEVANFQEVFEDADVVIRGKSVPKEHVKFSVREVDGNKYFEKRYVGPDRELWGYKLPFGQNKKGGGLFPKRFLDDEDRAQNDDGGNGWRKFRRENNSGGNTTQAQPSKTTRNASNDDDGAPF